MRPRLIVGWVLALAALATPAAVQAQNATPQQRSGLWFNAGLGYGSMGCEDCEERTGGISGGLALGGTLTDRVLLGVGSTGWYKSEDGASLSIGTLDARVRFYPSRTSGFFLTGGLGLGTIAFDIDYFGGDTKVGLGAVLGLGWDIRVRPNVSITPFWNGSAVRASDTNANFGQIGVGVTIH